MHSPNKALLLHKKLRGKLEVRSKHRLKNKKDLSLLYTPGVAEAVSIISRNKEAVYDLTIKNNSVAVITDGSAVLGMGNVGPEAALPVMEGKCAIFKEMAGIDAYPVCLSTQNTEQIVQTIKNISPGFGGINLEDISAPRCFAIEENLQSLGIPVVHDDQHATSIVVLAGLMNAVKLVNKTLKECRVTVAGAGAAGTAIVKLLHDYGVKNIILVDSEGIISSKRTDLPLYKQKLLRITNKEDITGNLENAANKADILIGVSIKGLFNRRVIENLKTGAIVFALANPDPEISEKEARQWGVKVYANGRSDCNNQINNALVFPGFFKGLLKYRITKVSQKMKLKASSAIAELIRKPSVKNFIPDIFDDRLVEAIAESMRVSG